MQRRMVGRHYYYDRHFSVKRNGADVTVGVVTAVTVVCCAGGYGDVVTDAPAAAVASSLFP